MSANCSCSASRRATGRRPDARSQSGRRRPRPARSVNGDRASHGRRDLARWTVRLTEPSSSSGRPAAIRPAGPHGSDDQLFPAVGAGEFARVLADGGSATSCSWPPRRYCRSGVTRRSNRRALASVNSSDRCRWLDENRAGPRAVVTAGVMAGRTTGGSIDVVLRRFANWRDRDARRST